MSEDVQPVPEEYGTVTPSLTVDGCGEALAFYEEALGAEVLSRAGGPGGKVWHAEIRVGDSRIMVNDEFPGHGASAPTTLGGSSVSLWLYVEDADAAWRRMVDAGAEGEMEPEDMFWGDRMGSVIDPWGHRWSLATRVEDLSPEELERRQQEALEEWGG